MASNEKDGERQYANSLISVMREKAHLKAIRVSQGTLNSGHISRDMPLMP